MNDIGRQAGELLLDVFEDPATPVGMWVVGAPHHGLDADIIDQLGADRIELNVALHWRRQYSLGFSSSIAEAVLIFEIHAIGA